MLKNLNIFDILGNVKIMGVIQLRNTKKTKEKSQGKHSKNEEKIREPKVKKKVNK